MITTIIFDLGGVLVPEKGAEITAIIAAQIGVSSQTLDEAIAPYKDAMTNTELEIGEFNKKRRAGDGKTLFEYFQQAFLSTDMHMKKPDAEIYKTVLKELKCKPESALFIDDKQAYVDGARNVGIRSILYKNPEQLKKEMERFGVTF